MKNGSQQTAPDWPEAIRAELTGAMLRTHGVDLSGYEDSFLAKTLEKRRQATFMPTAAAYLERLTADRAEAAELAGALCITYSDFFRNPLAFALLEQIILPGLIEAQEKAGQGEIRIWSAGCAAGQEPWSVAMLLDDLSGRRDRAVPYRIFATDRSAPDLALAHAGVYSAAAVANVRLRHLSTCFTSNGETYVIADRLRERVAFSHYDLLAPGTTCPPASIYGDFDLVLCCNVLLYYRPEAQRLMVDKLRHSLAAGGYLLTGETERQIVESAGGFRAVAPPASVFQQKGAS